MEMKDCEPTDPVEIENYVIAAYEVLESMREAGLLKGPSDRLTSKAHERLERAHASGWRPERRWLFQAVINILEEDNGELWPEEKERVVIAGVSRYVGRMVYVPAENN